MLERYLGELKRELGRTLSGDDLRSRLAEAELHIQEDVASRMELGQSRADAEREALLAFGHPTTLARADSSTAGPRIAILLAGYSAFLLTFSLTWWIMPHGRTMPLVAGAILIWLAILASFALLAYRTRRPAPLAIAAAGCVASLAVTLVLGTTTISRQGAGLLPKAKVAAVRRMYADELQGRLSEGALLRSEVARLNEATGIGSFRKPSGFHVPIPASASLWGIPLAYHDVPRPNEAKEDVRHAWRENASNVERIRRDIAEIDEGMVHPIQNLRTIGPEVLTDGLVATAFATLVDLAFGVLGACALSVRNRRSPDVA